jgi:hypothetical protein
MKNPGHVFTGQTLSVEGCAFCISVIMSPIFTAHRPYPCNKRALILAQEKSWFPLYIVLAASPDNLDSTKFT